jgi:hypothetical protein
MLLIIGSCPESVRIVTFFIKKKSKEIFGFLSSVPCWPVTNKLHVFRRSRVCFSFAVSRDPA